MINDNMIVSPNITLLEAMRTMDNVRHKILIICEGRRFLGLITIGDIQRAILSEHSLSEPVNNFVRSDLIYSSSIDDKEYIKNLMKEKRLECMPIVDNGVLNDIIEWNKVFHSNENIEEKIQDVPLVIMAGGEGTRLRPLTNVLPKPLIPISEKTMIEEIIEKFGRNGCTDFFVSLNYKADVIKDYINNCNYEDKGYHIKYIQENKPLGTAGSLSLLRNMLDKTFIVINCDVLLDVNILDVLKYHRENNNIITVISVLKNYSIPYGTLKTGQNGILTDLQEKPELLYQVNSGLYILEPGVFELIMDDMFLNITDLIKKCIEIGRVGVFPVSEGSWIDMGNWDEYLKLVRRGVRG